MGLRPHSQTIVAAIVSVIIHVGFSIVSFFAGLSLIFALFRNRYLVYDFNIFLVAGIATALLYISVTVIIGIVFYKLTKLKRVSIIFITVSIPFALFVGFGTYSYILGM